MQYLLLVTMTLQTNDGAVMGGTAMEKQTAYECSNPACRRLTEDYYCSLDCERKYEPSFVEGDGSNDESCAADVEYAAWIAYGKGG